MGDNETTAVMANVISSISTTMTPPPPDTAVDDKAIYALAIAQFIFGSVIAALNMLTLGATIASRKMRTASYFLASNLWFANLLLGVVVAVANVVDHDDVTALEKTEGTVSVMNTLATLVTLIALCTARLVSVKAPHHRMGSSTALKIIISSWILIFVLTLIKSIVYALYKMETTGVCYKCLLSFEASIIIIFALVCIVLFLLTIYSISVYKRSTVQDSSSPTNNFDLVKETKDTVTVGLWVFVFLIPCLAYVFTLAAFTVTPNLNKVAVEATVLIFYIHCIVNPLICICRDADVRNNVKKIIWCTRPTDGQFEQAPANGPATRIVTPPTIANDRLPPIGLTQSGTFANGLTGDPLNGPLESVRSQPDAVKSDERRSLKVVSIDNEEDDVFKAHPLVNHNNSEPEPAEPNENETNSLTAALDVAVLGQQNSEHSAEFSAGGFTRPTVPPLDVSVEVINSTSEDKDSGEQPNNWST